MSARNIILLPDENEEDENGIKKPKKMIWVEVAVSSAIINLTAVANSYDTASYTAEEVYQQTTSVLNQDNHVSSDLARRFLNNLHYGGFAEIDPELQASGIGGLNLEAKLTLYESIAQEHNERNLQYLSALNAEMKLGNDFYTRGSRESAQFFESGNLSYLANANPNLMMGLSRLLKGQEQIKPDVKEKIYQGLIDAYCDFCEIPRKQIHFCHNKDAKLQGFYSPQDDSITMNTNTDDFRINPMGTIETLIHEARHGKQHALANAYRSGGIPAGHPNYVAARVFNANINTIGGYIGAGWNYSAYHGQPAEVDARTAGESAVASLQKNMKYLTQYLRPVARATPLLSFAL